MSEVVLPEGWIITKLDSLGEILTGRTPSKNNPNYFDGDIPFIKPSDLNGGGYIAETVETLTIQGAESVVRVPVNSILVTCIGNLGKLGITTKESAFNQQINAIIPSSLINIRFLYHYLKTIKPWLEKEASATTVTIINKGKFSLAPIFLAPLAEQKVIADKLDSLLAQVDNIKNRLDALPTIIKRFKQSVLSAAVSGRLTEEWRGNNEYDGEGFPVVWFKKGLSDIGYLGRGKSKHRPRNDVRLFGTEYPFIQTGEVANCGGKIKFATKFYSEFGLLQSKLFPVGTLCITIAANIADTAILEIEACFPDSIVGFTPNHKACLVEFVKFLIDANKDNLEAFAPATAQKNINLKILNEMQLPLPTLEEQTEIVRRVEQLFAYADQIEQQVKNAQNRVNNLTQAVLAKAFRGELTADWRAANPHLISGENSAQALLAKIKAERDKPKKTSKQQTMFNE